ncbi:hypothetical protein BVC80_1665g67 [Macleaya cordata]|uniref:Uncharacterized protein n=1 Tax=Macleaya cordata TaxID=56857 RepID=A0A200RBP8_MACCD|nr:hypothetical protein BVC80_1665g67 [Macleaya cordata]
MEERREGEHRISGFYHRFIGYVMNSPVGRGIKRIARGRQMEHALGRRDSTGTSINIETIEQANGSGQNSNQLGTGGLGSSTPSPPVLKKGSAIVGGRQTQVQTEKS